MIYGFTSVQSRYADATEDISVKKRISTFGTVNLKLGQVSVSCCIHYVEVDSLVKRVSKLHTLM